MKALCSESTSDVNTCSDVTSVLVHSKTPLHRRVQASVFWSYTTLHSSALRVGTSCCHSVHFNCLPFNRRSIRPAVARSFSYHLNRHKDHVPALGGRVHFVQIVSSDPLLPRSTAAKRRADDSTVTWRLYQCSTTGTKNEGWTADCNPNKKTVKWDINVDGVLTSFSASEVITASRSEACHCCTWNCSLSVRNRRHHDSPRMCTSVARQTSTNLPLSRTGTVRTFLDSASSMRAFNCAECEVVHFGLPEEVG